MPSKPLTTGGIRFSARPKGFRRRLSCGIPLFFQTWNTTFEVVIERVGDVDPNKPVESEWELGLEFPDGKFVVQKFLTTDMELGNWRTIDFPVMYTRPGHHRFILHRGPRDGGDSKYFYSYDVGADKTLWLLPFAAITAIVALSSNLCQPDVNPTFSPVIEPPVNNIQIVLPAPQPPITPVSP
jgi:hypothetical protein